MHTPSSSLNIINCSNNNFNINMKAAAVSCNEEEGGEVRQRGLRHQILGPCGSCGGVEGGKGECALRRGERGKVCVGKGAAVEGRGMEEGCGGEGDGWGVYIGREGLGFGSGLPSR
ncbi:uncharacterized protein DS421_6g192930 [Arachis hypogaea]|nr:uncharacterized protein DS421_6g192930 [Arachis hypogaea]